MRKVMPALLTGPLLCLFLLCVQPVSAQIQADEGITGPNHQKYLDQIVFDTRPIGRDSMNVEPDHFKRKFGPGQSIYARAFMSGPLGRFHNDLKEYYHVTVEVDGKNPVKDDRAFLPVKHPSPLHDGKQITSFSFIIIPAPGDEPQMEAQEVRDAMNALKPGDHQIRVTCWPGVQGDAPRTNKLAEGTFIYTIPGGPDTKAAPVVAETKPAETKPVIASVPEPKPATAPVVAETKPVVTTPKPLETKPVIASTPAPAPKPAASPVVAETKPVFSTPKPVETKPLPAKPVTETKPVSDPAPQKPAASAPPVTKPTAEATKPAAPAPSANAHKIAEAINSSDANKTGKNFNDMKTGMENPEIAAEFLKLVQENAKSHHVKERYSKLKVKSNAWTVIKNKYTNAPASRTLEVWGYATWPDGHCSYQTFQIQEIYDGVKYGAPYADAVPNTMETCDCIAAK